MTDSFERIRGRRSRLPDPPGDVSSNLDAPETAPPASTGDTVSRRRSADIDPARIDGRARLRTDRTEALSTKIRRQHRELLLSLADAYRATLSETLERAIDNLAETARRDGTLPR